MDINFFICIFASNIKKRYNMSYFVANTLTISKDFKTFKVKGGDNNVVPRSNYWSGDIEIEQLLDCISSGSIQFGNTFNEKLLLIKELAFKYKKQFGGYWDQETDMYHSSRKVPVPTELPNLNKAFLSELKKELKGYTKKEYIVKIDTLYVYERRRNEVYRTSYIENAKKFGKYQAKELIKSYRNYICEIIKK